VRYEEVRKDETLVSFVVSPHGSEPGIKFKEQNRCSLTPAISSFKMGLSPMLKEVD
jgi:hypothetical protein